LILKQDRTYSEIAQVLRIDEDTVRSRAHAALAALGPRATPLTGERQSELADFLLSQQPASARAAARAHLERSASARAWARVVASELRPLAGDALPDIPTEGAEMDEAFDALQARTAVRADAARSSRLGGILLLTGLGILIAVVLILVLSGGSSNKSDNAVAPTPSPASTQGASTTSTQPQIIGQVNLAPPHGGKALGVANLLAQGGQRALAIQAQGMTPSTSRSFYAVWLYNSASDSQRLGFAPPVAKNGRLQAVAGLPASASRFHQLIITRESARQPSQPGPIVLGGALSIPAA
jgi:hypothetical protein